MTLVSGGRPAAVVVLAVAVTVVAGFVPTPTSSAGEPLRPTAAPTPARTNPAPAPSPAWRTPDPSTERPAAEILGQTSGSVRLSVVRASDNGPLTSTEVLPGRQAALTAVAAAQDDPQVLAVEEAAPVRLLAADPLRSSQWALDILRAETVWQSSTGSGVRVAVVDTGVYADHPDLGRAEAGGPVLSGADCTTGGATCSGTGRTDGHGHGTHVAGIVAARHGNGVGISGLAPDARILPVQVLTAEGYGYDSWVANGIRYAANHDADVINLSLGSASNSIAISTAVDYARAQGVIVAAAAGNGGVYAGPSYPGALGTVIGVAATTSSDQVASFSTRGSYVDVSAPGQSVLSTLPSGYASWSGTSMATPYVAATVALMQEEKADLSAEEAASVLQRTATDLGSAGRDDDSGYGRINPGTAVACVQTGCDGTTPGPGVRQTTRLHFYPSVPPVASRLGTSVVKVRLIRGTSTTPVAGASTTLRMGPPARTVGTAVTNADGVAGFTVVNPRRSWVQGCFAGDAELLPDCTVRRWLRGSRR